MNFFLQKGGNLPCMKIVDVKRIKNFCAPAAWLSRITSPDCSHFVKQANIEQRIEALPEPFNFLLMGIREAIRRKCLNHDENSNAIKSEARLPVAGLYLYQMSWTAFQVALSASRHKRFQAHHIDCWVNRLVLGRRFH